MTLRSDFEAQIPRLSPFEHLELIDPAQLTAEESASVPPAWIAIAELDGRGAVDAALNLWETALPSRFPGTVSDLRERGLDVYLARAHPGQGWPTQLVLVYVLEHNAPQVPFGACFGYLPATSVALPAFWPLLADGLGRFHTAVHNGFRSEFGGILPTEGLRAVSADPDDDPGYEYVDEHFHTLPAERHPRLEDLVVVVRASLRGIALDVSTPDLTAWEISDLIQPCRLETWSALDALVMDSISSAPEKYQLLGYDQT